MARKSSDTCQLVFDAVQVDVSRRIGAERAGCRIAQSTLESGRIGTAAQSADMAQAVQHRATKCCRERESCGRPIVDHQTEDMQRTLISRLP